MGFRKDFLWGAATAAMQIEGGVVEGDRVRGIWDDCEAHTRDGKNANVACDHYHRYKEDVKLMKEIGLNSYRFSISWCRIIKEDGSVNEKGIEFYRNLINELKANNITPVVTLFHWDLPEWVEKKGGWLNEEIIDLFANYTKVCVEAFGNDVEHWITFNEPTCFMILGYFIKVFAPFKKVGLFKFRKMNRIFLLTHGKAVKTIRKYHPGNPKVGIVMAATAYVPLNNSEKELKKARKQTFNSTTGYSSNSMWMDPIVLKKKKGVLVSHLSKKDLDLIAEPLDFIGINTYQPLNKTNDKKTMIDWVIDGRCIYYVSKFYYERYKLPIFITENGMANPDVVSEDGKVHDEIRTEYFREYITNLKAVTDEVPVLGYMTWSLLDNFEWASGYAPRFGIVYTNYETQERIIKDSAYFYKSVIESNGENL